MSLLSKNQNGFSLVEVLVTAVLGILVALGTAKLISSGLKAQLQTNTTASTDLLRRNLLAQIQNTQAWNNTLADNPPPAGQTSNPSMACLRNTLLSCTHNGKATTDVPAGTPLANQPFRLRDAQNALVYDPVTNGSSGFTMNGSPCTGFSEAGNDACPIQYELTWTAICTGSCKNPQVKVSGLMKYRPQSPSRTIAMNSDNYSFEFIRGATTPTGSLKLLGISTLTLATATGGYVACNTTLNAAPVNYTAKGNWLTIHAQNQVTAYQACEAHSELQVSGPGIASPLYVLVAGVGINISSLGNISNFGSSQNVYAVEPGMSYTLSGRFRTTGAGATAGNSAQNTVLVIHDYQTE